MYQSIFSFEQLLFFFRLFYLSNGFLRLLNLEQLNLLCHFPPRFPDFQFRNFFVCECWLRWIMHMAWHGSNTLQITSSKTSVTHTFFSLSNTISPILVISFLGNKSWNVSERPLSKNSDEKGKEKKKTSIAIGKLSTLHANAMTTKHTKILKSIEKWNTY